MCVPGACKYPADVAPFGGTADNSAASLRRLVSLLAPEETVYVMGDVPPGWPAGECYHALQMIAAGIPEGPLSRLELRVESDVSPVQLSAADADAMVELTTLAFPGFFRRRTCEMGAYYGIRIGGDLVAMAGERMAVPGYREISGVCTHPAHTGKGYAAKLIARLMQDHARAGLQSFLHVSAANERAIALYTRLGYWVRTEIRLHSVRGHAPENRALLNGGIQG